MNRTKNLPLAPARFQQVEERCGMALVAMRLLNGEAGGNKKRRLDTRTGSTWDGVVEAALAYWRQQRIEQAKVTEMRICGGDLRVGDAIAISTTRGMERYEAPVATTDAGESFLTTYTTTDGSRGSVAADERIWVRRVEG